jgi:hypothetical protein
VDWNGVEAKDTQQQGEAARGVAGTREDHAGAAGKLSQDIYRIAVLVLCGQEQILRAVQ